MANYNRFTGTEIVSDEENRRRRLRLDSEERGRLQREEELRKIRERDEEDGSNIVDAALLALIEQGAVEVYDNFSGNVGGSVLSQESDFTSGGGDFSGGGASGSFD